MFAIRKNPAVSIWQEVYLRNPLLASFGLMNVMGFLILMVFSYFDERTLLGINVWIKPMKFFISIGIFVWTMAWFLHYLPQLQKVKAISFGLVAVFVVEMFVIVGQAAMGKTSHFNISTPLDGALFGLMGMAIIVNTLLVVWTLFLFRKAEHLPKGYLWGIRLGLIIFLLGSMEGYVMISNMAHTVGAPDGADGWFFLNWAKRYGDLRIAHFLGLHALQAVPLFAWFVSRDQVKPVVVFSVVYGLLSLATFLQALAGIPLFFI